MPSAGGIAVPNIVPLRIPYSTGSGNQIDTNTLIEIKSDSDGSAVYFTTNGNKPAPFNKLDKSTIRYKGPFLLNKGKRQIKSIAVSSNGLRESDVVSKTFMVEYVPPEVDTNNEDDDQSFIMDTRRSSRNQSRRLNESVDGIIDLTRSTNNYPMTQTYPMVGVQAPMMPYPAWGSASPVPPTMQTRTTGTDYMFHYHMHEPQISPRAQPQSRPMVQPPVQVNSLDMNSWRPLSIPLPAVLNQSTGTQTVGLFYPTQEQAMKKQRINVDRMIEDSPSQTKMVPNLIDISPGRGYWKKQIAHICAHLEAYTQKNSEFRAEVGKPRMGKITSLEIDDDGVDVTLVLSFESRGGDNTVKGTRASQVRKSAIRAKRLAQEEDDSPYKQVTRAKKTGKSKSPKTENSSRLTPEEKKLIKEVGPNGEGDEEVVQDMLDEGADPNCENKDGTPALILATMNNHIDAVAILLDAEAEINSKAPARKGNTALHEAVLLGPDGQEIVEMLLENDANPKIKNAKGDTPYSLAVKSGYESTVSLFASSMGQEMLDKMTKKSKGKKEKSKNKKEKENDRLKEGQRSYKEKLPKDKGTVVAVKNFDPQGDAEKLRKAMKGFGTDEKTIIDIISQRSSDQRQKIAKQFKQMFGKDLMKEFKSELSGKLLAMLLGLMMTPEMYDAHELNKAIKGLGTDEDVLIEILCTRTNSSIEAIKEAYEEEYDKDLEEDVEDDTSGHFGRILISVLQGSRPEGDVVDPDKAKNDANDLYKAGEDKWGTDESRFNVILASRSYAQLRATFEEYSKISKNDIETAIKKEMSGDLKNSMLTIVRCVRNKHKYFSDKLHKTMKGAGTDDEKLMRIVISRSEVDMVNIKGEYQKAYSESLGKTIAGDTSGDYKKLLLNLVGGEN
ncbi:double zinc ribbon and ankyrin repeat-containing protein 1-like [Anneissia japonica]|uniref:double zinc ribbon and ankyrin repeat-containing protein 1-like n=1 Tax=Anneissia japonica TaxID=1529436 RepID=UPI0014259960|nr:double zinc ribbon and ankyrin repeat-containing protein 1-like [Anneissia japonica]